MKNHQSNRPANYSAGFTSPQGDNSNTQHCPDHVKILVGERYSTVLNATVQKVRVTSKPTTMGIAVLSVADLFAISPDGLSYSVNGDMGCCPADVQNVKLGDVIKWYGVKLAFGHLTADELGSSLLFAAAARAQHSCVSKNVAPPEADTEDSAERAACAVISGQPPSG